MVPQHRGSSAPHAAERASFNSAGPNRPNRGRMGLRDVHEGQILGATGRRRRSTRAENGFTLLKPSETARKSRRSYPATRRGDVHAADSPLAGALFGQDPDSADL